MTMSNLVWTKRQKAVWGPKRTLAMLTIAIMAFGSSGVSAAGKKKNDEDRSGSRHRTAGRKAEPGRPSSRVKNYRIDDELERRTKAHPNGVSRVIVTLVPGAKLPAELARYARFQKLDIINGQVLELPNRVIRALESRPEIFRIHYDRPTGNLNFRTSVTVGAKSVRWAFGYSGSGVGIAVIDSGITSWHDDLSGGVGPYGDQRVAKFVDFVNGQTMPYDDNGHGSHVAGIIAGNGYDSRGEKSGIAPGATLISLKVLDANGRGTIGNMIAALNWVAANHQTYNIRVVNMSVGARITESFWTDPLTLATKALVDRGIVVVGASGNFGRNANGELQYGGITAPSNAPWVLTVGASSTQGTLTRRDDVVAGFSSAGPTYIDFLAKPDLVAPGAGSVSLAVPGSTFYSTKAQYLVDGKPAIGFKPYLTLSGTSMAAPVVSGTVALMLQANPNLTPNLVKAILQYTAEANPDYNALRQGAGFLNTLGAVRLAKFYQNNRAGDRMPVQKIWSRQIIWGNYRLSGGYLNPRGNAWQTGVVWGAVRALNLDNIVWGTQCGGGACNDIVWGTGDVLGDNIVWGTNLLDNIVWGTTFVGDNIVWGTNLVDNIVWGTDCGGADCDNIVWGTTDSDNIVWGTADLLDNIVWGTSLLDNIVWGTSSVDEDVTWGSSDPEAVLYADDADLQPLPDPASEFGDPELASDPVVEATEPVVEPVVIGGGI